MHRRREFTKATQREAYARSGGICECHRVWQLPTYNTGCDQKLSPGNMFYEHIDPERISGNSDIDNCALLVKTCWTLKTASYDRPAVDKYKRVEDLAHAISSRFGRPIIGSVRSGIKLQFNGPPIDRATGKPWGQR